MAALYLSFLFYFAYLASSSFRLSSSQIHAHPSSTLFHISKCSGLGTTRATATHSRRARSHIDTERGIRKLLHEQWTDLLPHFGMCSGIENISKGSFASSVSPNSRILGFGVLFRERVPIGLKETHTSVFHFVGQGREIVCRHVSCRTPLRHIWAGTYGQRLHVQGLLCATLSRRESPTLRLRRRSGVPPPRHLRAVLSGHPLRGLGSPFLSVLQAVPLPWVRQPRSWLTLLPEVRGRRFAVSYVFCGRGLGLPPRRHRVSSRCPFRMWATLLRPLPHLGLPGGFQAAATGK